MKLQATQKAHPFWFFLSLGFALALSLLQLAFPQAHLLPNWLLITTLFWVILLPHNFSLFFAFLMGLLLDSLWVNLWEATHSFLRSRLGWQMGSQNRFKRTDPAAIY